MRNGPNKAHEMFHVVVDTNVLVSALIGRGKPRRLVLKLLEEHLIVLSRQMLVELADVLSREKFSDVRSSQVDKFLSGLVKKCKVVNVVPSFEVFKEDPDDDVVLNMAFSGKAEYMITGDKHLLALKEFKGVRIVKVTQMFDVIR